MMLRSKTLTVISGGALGVDLEAEKLARHYSLNVEVLFPPCHPRRETVKPLTHQQLGEAIPATKQVAACLNKQLENPISLHYIHRNYHVVKQADMVLAFTTFQPESNLCFGGTGWAVEIAKVLKKNSCLSTTCNVLFGSSITMSKACFTLAMKCLRNSLLHLPLYPELLLWGSGTFTIIPMLYSNCKRLLNEV